MEQKHTGGTNAVGRFISALRRANGMTQKELGDRLFVSDKTVSRWERGECDPELSLIPAIAEIFGITTDELLRGERDPQRSGAVASEGKTARGDRQFRSMLRGRLLRYRNLSLVSVGLMLTGLFAAALFNLALTSGTVGFCVGAVFLLAGGICQICLAANARIESDPDGETGDGAREGEIRRANSDVTRALLKVLALGIALFAFLLPTAVLTDPYTGLVFSYWLLYGGIFAGVALLAFGLVYVLWVRERLIRRGFLYYEEETVARFGAERRLLARTATVALAVALFLGAGIAVPEAVGVDAFARREVFDTYEAFEAYMEAHKKDRGPIYAQNGDAVYEEVVHPNVTVVTPSGETLSGSGEVFVSPEGDAEILPDESIAPEEDGDYGALTRDPETGHPIRTVEDGEGKVLSRYIYNSSYIAAIEFSFDVSEDGLPVRVITREARMEAFRICNGISALLWRLIAVDLLAAAAFWLLSVRKGRRRGAEGR